MKRIFLALILIVMCSLSITSCSKSQEKEFTDTVKTEQVKSNKQVVTVYDYNGKEIKSWTAMYDVYRRSCGNFHVRGNSAYFYTEDGKRVCIHSGIIICEEK